MKTIVAIIAAMVVSSAITFMITSSTTQTKVQERKNTEQDTHKEELAELRKELVNLRAKANSQAANVLKETSIKVPGVVTDPADLIDQLSADGATGADVESQKRVIHYFESLVDAGEESLPAISNFMAQGVDKEFGRPSFRQQLGITNAQAEEMRAFVTESWGEGSEMRKKMGELWSNQEMSREEKMQEMRKIGESSREKFMGMMTDEQKAQMEQMGGSQEERVRNMMRGMMGGGGDRGGRGGGDRGGGGRGGR
jgi:ribosomal protein L29